MYKIIRMYSRSGTGEQHLQTKQRTIETGLTLEQALAHCNDPETSSSTCTHNRVKGGWKWFDSYEKT